MKTRGAIIVAVVALFAATTADARIPVPRPSVPEPCTITVAFGSYGPGIDLATLTSMERWLRGDRRVRSVVRHSRGREGELTLCVRTRAYKGADRLARQLRQMIPARPRGPITIVQYLDPHD